MPSKAKTSSAKKSSSSSSNKFYGIKKNKSIYLYNLAKSPLHPWATNRFTWGGIHFRRLEQCLAYYKMEHFKLGDYKKTQKKIMEAQTGWDVVKILREQELSSNDDWKGWGRWVGENIYSILQQMAKESSGFRKELMSIKQPNIGLCTKDKFLGMGLAELPSNMKKLELGSWEGHNVLGNELVKLRTELEANEEEDSSDSSDDDDNSNQKTHKQEKMEEEEDQEGEEQKKKIKEEEEEET